MLELNIMNVVRGQLAQISTEVVIVVVASLRCLQAPWPGLAGGRRHCDAGSHLRVCLAENIDNATACMTAWMTACMWTGGVSLRDINTRTGDGWSRSWPRIRGGRQKQTGARSQHCPAPSINLRAGARSRGQRGQRSVFKLENCAVTYDTRHRPK